MQLIEYRDVTDFAGLVIYDVIMKLLLCPFQKYDNGITRLCKIWAEFHP